jgi:hypothetical protein
VGSDSVRTAQLDTTLSKPPVIILQMRTSTRSRKDVPRASPHLETPTTDTTFT